MIGQGAVVGNLVTFLQDGSHDATEGLPGRMVVDLGCGSRRADEHFQRVVMLGAVVALGNIPVLGPSHLPKKGVGSQMEILSLYATFHQSA
jgi:hypothetical protein